MTQRYKLIIEYNGTDFVGWQRQENGLSIQQVLEEAAAGYCQKKITVNGAGRTDSGVHALGQVAHVDLPRTDNCEKVRDAFNAYLRPYRVVVVAVEKVHPSFHARFDAIERSYFYVINNRRPPPALGVNCSWWVSKPLNEHHMNSAAQLLIGKHDFSSFRASGCQSASPIKTLLQLDVERKGSKLIITARARSFLHHQVRNFVGSLVLVGKGKWTEKSIQVALDSKDRRSGGPTAPPHGLYLDHVIYTDHD
jgi:tRNA pseudouridine38-40 synthase